MKSEKEINNLSASLILQKKYKEAEHTLTKALKKYPNSPELLINTGSLYQLTGNPKKAVENFEKCLHITERYPQVYSKLHHQKMQICDWENIEKITKLANKFDHYETAFTNVLRVDNPKTNLKVAKNERPSKRIQQLR